METRNKRAALEGKSSAANRTIYKWPDIQGHTKEAF
jgi:hypothetical protein